MARLLRNPTARPVKTRRPGRPTREEALALRQSILDAALAVFGEKGFSGASMERIARQAGVAKPTLYRHYADKDALFVEVARREQLRVRARIQGLGTIVDGGGAIEPVLREIVEKLYDGFTSPEYLAVMRLVIGESRRFPKLGRAMLNDAKIISAPLIDYLQQLAATGRISVVSAVDAATQISGLASGAGRYMLVTPSRHPAGRRRWVESIVGLFVRAWAP